MFGKLFSAVIIASSLIAGVASKPIQTNRLSQYFYCPLEAYILTPHVADCWLNSAARGDISFDNWHGISSFNGFDSFYGSENFIGTISSQTVVEQDQELVCHTQSIEIIQQRLLVLQEMAKRCVFNLL